MAARRLGQPGSNPQAVETVTRREVRSWRGTLLGHQLRRQSRRQLRRFGQRRSDAGGVDPNTGGQLRTLKGHVDECRVAASVPTERIVWRAGTERSSLGLRERSELRILYGARGRRPQLRHQPRRPLCRLCGRRQVAQDLGRRVGGSFCERALCRALFCVATHSTASCGRAERSRQRLPDRVGRHRVDRPSPLRRQRVGAIRALPAGGTEIHLQLNNWPGVACSRPAVQGRLRINTF